MKIDNDELYFDINGLYNFFLEKGYTEGLTRKDLKKLKQLNYDISRDLITSSNDWQKLYKNIANLIYELIEYGILHQYSEETIQYLKENASLLPLVLANSTGKSKTDYIKLYSDDSYMFLCQFHNERTPSMGVTDSKNLFYCFGCGQGGNSIDYLMEYEYLSYKEAIKLLSNIYLIDLKEEKELPKEKIELVEKYQKSITSFEYLELLERGQSRLQKRNDPREIFYQKRYSQIERIKNKEYDQNFNYKKPPQKIYLY